MSKRDIGGQLREAREERGWSLDDVARLTKLKRSVLLAIENNDFASLPAGLYRKAYLRIVASEVGLDPLQISREFDAIWDSSSR